MNARQITAGIARPIGIFGVLVTALAVGACRTNRSNNNNKITQQNEPTQEAPLESLTTTPDLILPVIAATALVNENNVNEQIIEEPALNETQIEPTIPQVSVIPVISVTVEELKTFQEAMNTLDLYSARAVLDGKKVIFPKGFTREDAEHIKGRKFGLPPNGKLVSVNIGTATDTKTKKKSMSFASVLSDVGKAVSHPELTPDEENALKEIIEFLEKNGPFNYDSIDLIMERLTVSDEETQEKVCKELKEGLKRLGVKESNK